MVLSVAIVGVILAWWLYRRRCRQKSGQSNTLPLPSRRSETAWEELWTSSALQDALQTFTLSGHGDLGMTFAASDVGMNVSALRVKTVAAGSAASEAAVPPGSLVVRINGKGVHGQTTDAARRMIAHAKRPLKLELLVPSEEEALMTRRTALPEHSDGSARGRQQAGTVVAPRPKAKLPPTKDSSPVTEEVVEAPAAGVRPMARETLTEPSAYMPLQMRGCATATVVSTNSVLRGEVRTTLSEPSAYMPISVAPKAGANEADAAQPAEETEPESLFSAVTTRLTAVTTRFVQGLTGQVGLEQASPQHEPGAAREEGRAEARDLTA